MTQTSRTSSIQFTELEDLQAAADLAASMQPGQSRLVLISGVFHQLLSTGTLRQLGTAIVFQAAGNQGAYTYYKGPGNSDTVAEVGDWRIGVDPNGALVRQYYDGNWTTIEEDPKPLG